MIPAYPGIFIYIPLTLSMILKTERLEVLKNNNNIAVIISELQKVMYNDIDDFETESDRYNYLNSFDAIGLISQPVEQFYSIISFDHSDIKTFTKELTVKINILLSLMNSNELFIISHLKFNIFGTLKNNYPPLKDALQKTKRLLGTLNYDETLKISLEDLPLLVETFFWIERCKPSAPEYIYFADVNGSFAFHLCKYGNIHFIEFENAVINDDVLSDFKMYFTDGCKEQFLNKPGIEGRVLSF